ncbi:hypothetical protein D3C80_1466740 [compost metagenome]
MNRNLIAQQAADARRHVDLDAVHTLAIDNRRDFNGNKRRQLLDKTSVRNVDRRLFITGIGKDPFHDRHYAFFQLQFDFRLHLPQIVAVEGVEIEDTAVIADLAGPADVLAKVAVAGDRQMVKLLQDLFEQRAVRPRIGAVFTAQRIALGAAFGLHQFAVIAGVGQNVAVARQAGEIVRCLGAYVGVSVFAAVFIAGLQQHAEVV